MVCRLGQILSTVASLLTFYALVTSGVSDSHANRAEIFYRRNTLPRSKCHGGILVHISTILTTMKWRVIFMMYENHDSMTISDIVRYMEVKHSDVLYIKINVDQSSENISTILIRRYRDTGSKWSIPVFIITRSKKMLNILQMVDNLDFRSNKTTNYRTNSFWVVISDQSFIYKVLSSWNFNLKHMILLHCFRDGRVELLTVPDMQEVRQRLDGNDDIDKYETTYLFPNSNFKYCERNLVVSTLESEVIQSTGKAGEYKGYLVELFKLMAKTLNFTYTFVEPMDRNFGIQLENGSWNGLIGQLERYEVDVVLAELTVVTERLEVVDYIFPPFYQEGFGIVFKSNIDQDRNRGWANIFRPLNVRVYMFVLIAVVFVAMLLLITESINTTSEKTITTGEELKNLLKKPKYIVVIITLQLLHRVFNLLGFISIRGDGIQSRRTPTRFLVAFVWTFCIVITGVYIGNLTASLSDTRVMAPFNNLEDLIRLTGWRWGIRGATIDQTILQGSNDSLIRVMWQKVQEFNQTDPTVLSNNDSIQLNKILTEEKYVYLISSPDIVIANEPECTFGSIGGIIPDLSLSFAVSKDSYLRADLEMVMGRLIDSGISNNLKRKHMSEVQKWNSVTCNSKQPIRAMQLEDTLGAFLLLIGGVVLGTVVLLLEQLVYKFFR